MVRREQERQQVQAFHLFVEDSVEIGAGRVLRCSSDVLCLRHIHLRGNPCWFFRSTCFITCLASMPLGRNFAPSLIHSERAFSPSWLMAITSQGPPPWHGPRS